MKKESLILAAMAGLTIGANVDDAEAKGKKPKMKEVEKCWGVNKCGPHSTCGVSQSHIKATKKDFGDKFAKSTTHDCNALGKCSADQGQLNWVYVAKGHCLRIKGGFLIEKNDKNEWVVKNEA